MLVNCGIGCWRIPYNESIKAVVEIDGMKYLNVQQTDSTLIAILDELTATQTEVVITREGIPVARIVPWQGKPISTHHYPLRGMPIKIAEDFDEPMPELLNL
ncbi:MAG: type II toxin-antitoxin system Phd/YefM family antitoxin [Chlorogloeopsis fritschii C42_A2020_084]|uniref:type II toxin-antitoxin system Phd/YefM family antitoxin n=1 Tax=Chlorogloeopsis fritschii TaxID=1124 RepID=UPI0019F1A07F|nr:type II toxin-antitoxin system Phd/YefM family antitoxin [Chlorogloeopsis fritschii]MBF2004375.1 type II toxin-antitoxin system Phd/YefM family antitoxin [Chlorogloeopsis fritschii C42_A2020_084]